MSVDGEGAGGGRHDGGEYDGGEYDVVVAGGGAAGLSAALVLAQARRRVLVADAGAPRNASSRHLHGYLSRDGCDPAGLLETGRAEVRRYGGHLVARSVTEARRDGDGFAVTLDGGGTARGRRLLVATGSRDVLPELPGLAERWARDVLHCPYCHGHEVRDRPIAVLGSDPDGPQHALMLRQWSRDVTLLQRVPIDRTDRRKLAARGVRLVEEEVAALVAGPDRLTGVLLADGSVVECAAVFVTPVSSPNDALLTALGCERDPEGRVRVDGDGRTDVPGVWAAGNVVDETAQVITSAAAGLTAAVSINADLVEADAQVAMAAGGDRVGG